jgi:predicted nucleotidyltransferase
VNSQQVLMRLASHREELSRLGVRSLALFGSAARDEAEAASDVDLVVEFEGPATFDGYVELSGYLEDLLGRPVDLLTRRSLPRSLRASIERDLRYVPGLSPVP